MTTSRRYQTSCGIYSGDLQIAINQGKNLVITFFSHKNNEQMKLPAASCRVSKYKLRVSAVITVDVK